MEKRADPTKKDRLVASKKSWNETVKLLIAKLIAFKRGINGKGDDDAMLPEIDLKDPFPVEFHTYLASIVDDYSKVVQGADFVMNLQDDFSVTRRKSRKESGAGELREVAASIDNQDRLEAQASWVGSRAWAWFALHRLGKDVRRVRLRMLNIVRKSVHALNTIEYNFTSSSPGSDVMAIVGLTKFINLYIGGYLPRLEQLKQIDEKGLEESETPQLEAPKAEPVTEPGTEDIGEDIVSGAPPDAGPDIDNLKAQVHAGLKVRNDAIQNSSYPPKEKAQLDTLYKRLSAGKGSPLTPASDKDWLDVYELFIKHLTAAEGQVTNAQTEQEEYRKIAQNTIQRWFSRKMLEWNPSKTDELKMQISDQILATVSKFKELMDDIESLERSTPDLEAKTAEVSALLKSVGEFTITLADDYRMSWRMEQDPKARPARLEESVTSKLKKLVKML